MYVSWFEYNVTKPYPFRWFTPVTIVGGVIFTILLSFLNFSASGLNMETIYSNDPNTTERDANSAWFMQKPFNWGDNFRAKCEPIVVPVGSQFFTTNFGLRYLVNGISRYDPHTDSTVQLPSMSYLNHTLQGCRMDSVLINLRKADGSQPPSYWWSWDDSTSTAFAICRVDTAEGPVDISFGTPFSSPIDFSYLIQSNYTTHASLWWGSRLLNLYWYGMLVTTAHVRTRDSPPTNEYYVKGMLQYHSAGNDVKNSDTYFNLAYYYLQTGGTLLNQNNNPASRLSYYNNPNNTLSESMTEGLQFAKMFRSLLAIDLGNSADPNLLLDPDLLQYAIYAPDDSNRHINALGQRGPLNFTKGEVGDWANYNGINWPGTSLDAANRTALNESYPLFKDIVGPLETKPATIYAQYACSVPMRKSTGTLLLAVLLADLVFLQALWKVFSWTAEGMVHRRDPASRVCVGCLPSGGNVEQIGLERFSTKFGSDDGNGSDSGMRLVP